MSLTNPTRKITCGKPGAGDLMSLKFENYGFSIIKGAATLLGIDMKSFFHPVSSYKFAHTTIRSNESIAVDSCNVSNENGAVTGIIIIAEYPNVDISDAILHENQKYLTFNYHGGPQMSIGKLMVLTGTQLMGWSLEGSPGELILNNPHPNFDVNLKILIIS
jgi:hypothetical protein